MTPPTNPPAAKPKSKPTSTLEQVQQVYSGSNVARSSIKVTGVELFEVTGHEPLAADQDRVPHIVAIVGGLGNPIIEGADVTRAVIAATQDPLVLAQTALAVSERNGDVLSKPEDDQQTKANVGPPTLANGIVTFWLMTRGMGRQLMMGKLDLASAKLALGGPPQTPADRIAKAIESLAAGTSLAMMQTAVTTLAANCTDTTARDALFDTILHHKREEIRAAAVDASPPCGAVVVDTLIAALDKDASSTVKWKAANALGALGDSKAKPALEKASQSTDSTVKSAATRALGKLK